jgi:uncharacterized protein YcsI (UPF0317 family)
MRQNSVYYRIYVALRSDYVWRLISYSYYIKNAQVSDNIEFRHIDQNISQLLFTERDRNMIQDSVSLDDEDAENCIVILIEMHRHLAK